MPAAVLTEANALRWLGSAQYELAGLVLIATGRTSFSATLEIEAADGTFATRELPECSFVQAQVNMHMGKRVPFAPSAKMDDGLLDLVIITRSSGLDILHANARARGATHVELPFVEVVQCKSYTLTPSSRESAPLNLDGELVGQGGPFRTVCVPKALEVFSASFRAEPRDSSAEFEPQLVLSLVSLLEGDRVAV